MEEQKAVLLSKRNFVFSKLTALCEDFRDPQNITLFTSQAKYQRVNNLEGQFNEIENSILDYNAKVPAADRISYEKEARSIDDLIDTIRAAYFKCLEVNKSKPAIAQSTQLPALNLINFDGSISHWVDFITLYNSLVHENVHLSNVQKFHYLRSHLKGEPASLLSSFVIDDVNYPLAYAALNDRYQNLRRLATHFLNQILKFDIKQFTPQKFLDVHECAVNALKNLSLQNLGDFVLFQLCYNNLPVHAQRSFDMKQNITNVPSTASLIEHLNVIAKSEELKSDISANKIVKKEETKPHFKGYGTPRSFLGTSQKCICCNESATHKLFQCEMFKKKSVDDRYQLIRRNKLCFNCLGLHERRFCKSLGKCKNCNSNKHHTLLHTEQSSIVNNPASSTPPQESFDIPNSLSCLSNNKVLLGTAKAWISDAYGQQHLVRIVVDPGSQVACITESCAEKLHLQKTACNLEISGISNAAARTKGIVQCTLNSIYGSDSVPVSAVVLKSISNVMPSSSLPAEVFNRFKHLKLADRTFYKPQPVDMLLGADFYCHILSSETPNVISGSPTAIKTTFGWLLMGSLQVPASNERVTSLFVLSPTLDNTLKQFWETEEPEPQLFSSIENKYVEEHFVATHSRDKSGRYSVSLPFKQTATPVTSNSQLAFKSYRNLEIRLSKKPDIQKDYNDFLQVYLELGHMEPAKHTPVYVLPHHCVLKTASSSTKTRVVFNGSFPDSSGVSLNQRLCTGPKLQRDICDILLAWRFLKIPLVCDIRMMYRQIMLDPQDRCFQNIYWRPNTASKIQLYKLNTVTYGLAPSAYQAQRVLQQLVSDEGSDFPLASHALLQQTYVDDIVTGANSVEECIDLYNQLQTLMLKGGFELRKWSSTNLEVLNNIPDEHREVPLTFSSDDACIKILGLIWEPDTDSFRYSVQEFKGTVTKRSILSFVARIFDPMGWLSPIVFWLKHFIQKLWKDELNWDSPLTTILLQEWSEFTFNVSALLHFRLPRPIAVSSDFRLIGFCDSSERGYSAVCYIHSSCFGQASVHLLKAKSKVAPLKTISLPRLELCGAHLLAKLLSSLRRSSSLPVMNAIHLFSDSMIVLSWIKTEPYLLKTFVANRISEIQKLTQDCSWAHVNSENNPADLSSRGTLPHLIQNYPLWTNGPNFLYTDVSFWPQPSNVSLPLALPEVKPTGTNLLGVEDCANPIWHLILRTSSFTRLIRITAYVRRFTSRLRRQEFETTSYITSFELNSATLMLVKVAQQYDFSEDLQRISKKLTMSPSLQRLDAFLGPDGLLMVGGRLRHSSLAEQAKHPFLLKKDNPLSRLICRHYHDQYLHAGPDVLISLIRQRYWILSLRSLVRLIAYQCRNCARLKASTLQPRMADLPAARVQVSRVFSSVATDFCGPFDVKDSQLKRSRRYKGYLCIFVCMAVKAVHLEFVSDLSTEAFLAAFNRFISRRSLPSDVYSDCGRNYIGAARQFREIHNFLEINADEIQSSLASKGVKWHFNPPYAPNFGGLWEAAVKSAKSLLYRSLGNTCLTFEEYSTLFCRIEAILNSRPLTGPSSSPLDTVDYLTPAHFLVGSSLYSLPEVPISSDITLHCRWTRLKQMSQYFWRRWSKEYLHTLMQRNKWTKEVPNITTGTLVYVTNLNTSPLSWPLGRVVKVLPGQDGVVRVVEVRTAAGVFVRPTNKLVLVPSFS